MDASRWKVNPINLAFRSITSDKTPVYKSNVTVIIHTKERNYKVFSVLSIDVVRDYNAMMMEDIQIKVSVPMGDYVYLLHPHKDHLEVTIKKIYLTETDMREDETEPISEIRYKAIFDPNNPNFGSNGTSTQSQASMNSMKMLDIKLRLLDRAAEPLRVKMTQGVFRNVGAKKLMEGLLLGESQKVLVDGKPCVDGIDVVEPDNKSVVRQVIIPSGTYVCEIPTYLQEKSEGVYKYGMGTFLQRYKNKLTWFIYPLFDSTRVDNGEDRDVVTIYAVPPRYSSGIEKTFRKNGSNVEILATDSKFQVGETNTKQLNKGVGFRLMDGAALSKKAVMINEDGQAIAARGNLNREVSFVDREDGLQHVPVIKDPTTNPYHLTSEVAAREVIILQFIWENCDIDLLYPGMPASYKMVQDDDIVTLRGTVIGTHGMQLRMGTLSQQTRYSHKAVVYLAIEVSKDIPLFSGENSLDPKS